MSDKPRNKGRRIHSQKIAGNISGTRVTMYAPILHYTEDWSPSLTYSPVKVFGCEWEFPCLCEGNDVYYTTVSW